MSTSSGTPLIAVGGCVGTVEALGLVVGPHQFEELLHRGVLWRVLHRGECAILREAKLSKIQLLVKLLTQNATRVGSTIVTR